MYIKDQKNRQNKVPYLKPISRRIQKRRDVQGKREEIKEQQTKKKQKNTQNGQREEKRQNDSKMS